RWVRTATFKEWAGQSNVLVDKNGEPLLVWHATPSAFRPNRGVPFWTWLLGPTGANSSGKPVTLGDRIFGARGTPYHPYTYFSPRVDAALTYGQNITACFLRADGIRNIPEVSHGNDYE